MEQCNAVQYMSADDLSLQYCPHVTARNCTALEIHCTAQHTNTLYISQKYTAQFTEIHCTIHRNTLHNSQKYTVQFTEIHCTIQKYTILQCIAATDWKISTHFKQLAIVTFIITIKMIIFTSQSKWSFSHHKSKWGQCIALQCHISYVEDLYQKPSIRCNRCGSKVRTQEILEGIRIWYRVHCKVSKLN